jgi:large subunit ribosomal protein L22
MTAVKVKTNERPGTKCQVRYVRMSASKVRVVLDLIRGKHVSEATQILAFSERLAAQVIDKCLRSAVANAGHNDDIPAEELYISACYADEGASLKRFRPRARGRAGRIRKQTCHVTIVVSRYSDEQLDQMRTQAELRGASRGRQAPDARADRRRRVARSRGVGDSPAAQTSAEDTVVEDTVVEDTVVEDTVVEDTVVQSSPRTGEAEEVVDGSETAGDAPDSDEDAADEATEETN